MTDYLTLKTLFDDDLTLEEAEELIKNGADVNKKESNGTTPLFHVKDKLIAELLIKSGADVNHEDNYFKQTPMFCAEDKDIFKLLIDNGANIDHVDYLGNTLIHYGISIHFTKILITHGANVNIINKYKNSPLHMIHTDEITTLLINAGADVNAINGENKSVLETSPNVNHMKLLIQNGAVFYRIDNYLTHRHLVTPEQQRVFDSFASITSNDNEFFQMCLAYQNDQKNHVKINIKNMDII